MDKSPLKNDNSAHTATTPDVDHKTIHQGENTMLWDILNASALHVKHETKTDSVRITPKKIKPDFTAYINPKEWQQSNKYHRHNTLHPR